LLTLNRKQSESIQDKGKIPEIAQKDVTPACTLEGFSCQDHLLPKESIIKDVGKKK
jgi:hypothetical protein